MKRIQSYQASLSQKGDEKMRRFRMGSFVLILVVTGILFSTMAFGQTKLNYSTFFPAPHRNSVLAKEWGEEIAKRTNGKVQVTMFYGGTLTPADKCYDGVVKGISDIGFSVLSYTMGKFPLCEVLDLPLGSKTATTATRMVMTSTINSSPRNWMKSRSCIFTPMVRESSIPRSR